MNSGNRVMPSRARGTRERPEREQSRSPLVLTPVESEIAKLVAQGLSNREIGTALCRSEHTVADHIRAMRRRMGARNRAHLVALTFDHTRTLAAELSEV